LQDSRVVQSYFNTLKMGAAGLTECALNDVPPRRSQQRTLPPHLPILSGRFTRVYPLSNAHSVTYVSLKEADSPSHNTALSVKAMNEMYLCTGLIQWPSGLRSGSAVARLLELRVRISPRA